jgi:hypothetical protein
MLVVAHKVTIVAKKLCSLSFAQGVLQPHHQLLAAKDLHCANSPPAAATANWLP